MSNYLNLAITGGAPARLAILRTRAEQNTRAASMDGKPARIYADWRAARTSTFRNTTPALNQGYNGDDTSAARVPVWYCHADPQFRSERLAHEVARLRHRGWFSDAGGDETITGIVAGLSHGRFIAGYVCSENDERVYFDDVYTDESDAAHAADEHARVQAEKEKEYDKRWCAAQSLHGDCEAMENDISELFPMRHHARARRELFAFIQVLRTKRATLANDYADIEF